ncbi:hypothetical protein GCM10027406_31310 [Leifsonia lichenia]
MSDRNGVRSSSPVLAGVYPGQPRRVLLESVRTAMESKSPLIFAHVRATSYLSEWDTTRQRRDAFPHTDDGYLVAELEEVIRSAVGGAAVNWSLTLIDGDPPKALARLADEVSASRIVVGSRSRGAMSAVDEWLSRSVATRLVHLQSRPVIVVPVTETSAYSANAYSELTKR